MSCMKRPSSRLGGKGSDNADMQEDAKEAHLNQRREQDSQQTHCNNQRETSKPPSPSGPKQPRKMASQIHNQKNVTS